MSAFDCPKCATATKAHANPCYDGEMRECPKCGFTAYFDAWDAEGKYIEPTDDPF